MKRPDRSLIGAHAQLAETARRGYTPPPPKAPRWSLPAHKVAGWVAALIVGAVVFEVAKAWLS